MKAILMSDHAKWCALMMNGKKKVEVRKGTALYKAIQKLIDEYGFADIYVYCTKGKGLLGRILKKWTVFKPAKWVKNRYNGKVIFKFRCYKVEEIEYEDTYETDTLIEKELCSKSCLTKQELHKYLFYKTGTAIHIGDLEIFDKPKELSEFRTVNKTGMPQYEFGVGTCDYKKLTKAPQSFCYVEIGE